MALHDSVIIISSSPEFPSICDLLPTATKKPSLRTGSNAAPLPANASTAFTSAANLWQSSRVPEIEDNIDSTTRNTTTKNLPKPPAENAKPRQQGLRGGQKAAGAKVTKKTEQVASLGVTYEPAMESAVVEYSAVTKPGSKPRTAKETARAQTTLRKGQVTKPAVKEAKPGKKAKTISRHFAASVAPKPSSKHSEDDGLVVLEPAMRRRMDWTPPREIAGISHTTDSSAIKELSSSVKPAREEVFKTLQDAYGRNADLPPHGDGTAPLVNIDVLGKRKLVEMVAAAGSKRKTPEASPTKPKAATKKPRTITELATAAYRQPEDVAAEPKQDTLLGSLGTTSEQPVVTSKPGKAKATKRTAKPKAAKKPPARKQLLLSPSSALRQVAKQDFVFGTASQLATEDDPELLRALHEAMKASNHPTSDPFASPDVVNSNLAIRRRAEPGLWAAGARDDGGDLLDFEVLDLTRSSPLGFDHLTRITRASQKLAPSALPAGKAFTEIDLSEKVFAFNDSPSVVQAKQASPAPSHQITQEILLDDFPFSDYDDQPQTPEDDAQFEPPPSNQEQHQLLLSQSNSPEQVQPELPLRPNFELYTDARLAKEVASYGFKAIKKRTAQIALLEQYPASPSWHEKMLMYDPIVIEDLTTWLNAGQLDRVGPAQLTQGSILLLSPTNQVLLLHRVKTSTSFASAHVFPGGNLSSFHEGPLPAADSPALHQDGEAYRLAAVRETFEESGILLARKPGQSRDEGLMQIPDDVRDTGRKKIHGNKTKFSEWLQSVGGEPDVEYQSQRSALLEFLSETPTAQPSP
ncbi:5'-flap endonuclease [Collariella sp. IMI 366227]|nr:5'-flap endonuclease [Collariella sp. IMI 366227]